MQLSKQTGGHTTNVRNFNALSDNAVESTNAMSQKYVCMCAPTYRIQYVFVSIVNVSSALIGLSVICCLFGVVCVRVCACLCLALSSIVFMSVCIFVVHPSVCPPVRLFVHPCTVVFMPACVSVCSVVRLPVYVYVPPHLAGGKR